MKIEKGFTLVEIMITIGVGMIIMTFVTIGMFKFRDNVQYDTLINHIVESVSFSKQKAVTGRSDSSGQRIPYSVKFFEDRVVEFEGDEYDEEADTNIDYIVPFGLELGSECTPVDNGVVTFTPIFGENLNSCTVRIYKSEQPTELGSIVVGKYGIQVVD